MPDKTSTLRLAAVVAAVALTACGGSRPGRGAQSPLDPWEGRAVELFDDGVDTAAVGLGTSASARTDATFRARATAADSIVRVKVSTVTADNSSDDPYHLIVDVADRPLAGRVPPTSQIELKVRKSSPALGIIRQLDSRLIGMRFVAELRWFAGTDEPELHWHLSADSSDVVLAIQDAIALGDLRVR